MKVNHTDLAAFVAGELDSETADAMRLHLGVCQECQAELEHLILEESVTHPRGREAPRSAVSRPRQRTTARVVAACAVAASAVGIWIAVGKTEFVPSRSAEPLKLHADRSVEFRVPGADVYRPYNVQRATSSAAHEDFSLSALATLEARHEWSVLFAAYVLHGDNVAAAALLAKQPSKVARSVDPGVLALAQGHPDVALGHIDAALKLDPRSGPALWNDAVARRTLGLPLSSAARFDEVAALGEPGWAEEARASAAALRTEFEENRDAWLRAMQQWTTGADDIDAGLLRRFPDVATEALHERIRVAVGPDLTNIRAIAAALDGIDPQGAQSGRALVEAVRFVELANPRVRRPLAAEYSRLAGLGSPPATAWAALAERAAQSAPDIELGAWAHAVALDASYLPSFEARIPSDDPWLAAWAEAEISRVLIYRERRMAAAEVRLMHAVEQCPDDLVPVRCARLRGSLAVVLSQRGRRDLALQHLSRAFNSARRAKDWESELRLLYITGEISVGREPDTVDRVVVAAAYLDERSLQSPDCEADLYRLDHLATAALDLNRPAQARAWSDEADGLTRGRCHQIGPRMNGALARARLLQHTGAVDDATVKELRNDVAAMRIDATAGDSAVLDHIEGRLLIERDRAAGETLLLRAAAAGTAADPDSLALRARDLSLAVLARDAGRRGDFGAALEYLARELGRPKPSTCALGVAGEDRVVVAVIGPDGTVSGTYQEVAEKALLPAADVVSPDLSARLSGCSIVDVYAPGIYYGQAMLLPGALAWRYRSPLGTTTTAAAVPSVIRRVVVTGAEPPAALGLPALRDSPDITDAVVLSGASATPHRVLAEIRTATEIEIHAHGMVDVVEPGASALMLSADSDGEHALDAETVRVAQLIGHPLVLLAACHGAKVPTSDTPWGLADAFLAAGARSVVASTDALPDRGLGEEFAKIAAEVRRGTATAAAVRDRRQAHPDRLWLDSIVVFE